MYEDDVVGNVSSGCCRMYIELVWKRAELGIQPLNVTTITGLRPLDFDGVPFERSLN